MYDAEGNRVAKLSSGGAVETVYVLTAGNAQLDELSGSGAWNHTNIYAPGGRLLATYSAPGQAVPGYHYNLTDWLGTKRMQTTASGDQQEICTSNPFGDGLSCTGGADATEQHFTGKDHDTESGLDYFYARYYSETLGRFMTPDWAAAPAAVPNADYGDPQSLNLYAYVENDPIDLIDLSGHFGSDDMLTNAWQDYTEGMSYLYALSSDAGSFGADPESGYTSDSSPPTPAGHSKKWPKLVVQTVHVHGHVPPSPPLIPMYPIGEHFPSLPYPAPYGWDASTTATFLIGPGELMDIQRGFCWMEFKACLFSVDMAWAERSSLKALIPDRMGATALTTTLTITNAKRRGQYACFASYVGHLHTFEANLPNSKLPIIGPH